MPRSVSSKLPRYWSRTPNDPVTLLTLLNEFTSLLLNDPPDADSSSWNFPGAESVLAILVVPRRWWHEQADLSYGRLDPGSTCLLVYAIQTDNCHWLGPALKSSIFVLELRTRKSSVSHHQRSQAEQTTTSVATICGSIFLQKPTGMCPQITFGLRGKRLLEEGRIAEVRVIKPGSSVSSVLLSLRP